ncbi:unnamed protein product [Closterium sp. NIES-54]
MIEESGCQVHPGLPQGQAVWTRDEAKQQQSTGTPPVCPQGRPESDSGSGKAGREDAGGDGNGTRRGAVEGRSAIWCVPGTAGGSGRLVRRLVQAGRAGDAGRDAGARRSARPPVGPGGAGPGEGGRPRTCSRSGTKYVRGRRVPPEPAGTAPGLPAGAPAPVVPPAPAAPAPAPSDVPMSAEPPAPTPPAAPISVAPAAPGRAEPAAPVPPEAPAELPVGPTPATSAGPPGPAAPAPPGQVVAVVPPAPAARPQRRENHSRSSCGERTSRLDKAPRVASRVDPAPPGSAPSGSVPPVTAPPGSAPPVSAP